MSNIQNPGGGGGAGTDDQTAAEVPFTPAGTVAATDVQAAIVELDGDIQGHITDTSDAHDASAISVDSTTLVGTGTDVQAVLEELDNAIAAATGTPGGSDTQVQFNDSSVFGGDAGLVYNKTNDTLIITGTAYNEITKDALTIHNTVYSASVADGLHLGQYDDGGVFLSSGNYLTYFLLDAGGESFLQGGLEVNSGRFINSLIVNNAASVNNGKLALFDMSVTETDLSITDATYNTLVQTVYGPGGVASKSTLNNFTSSIVVQGVGDANTEYGGILNAMRVDIGTGYTQTIGPAGRAWLGDWAVHGPIAVQPDSLNGLTEVINNHYNGNPADSPSGGMWIVTEKGKGVGIDATHAAANTYPVQVGLGITGRSNNGSPGVGFTKGIQIGGSGSPWDETASIVGTGIHIRDYTTHGIKIDNASGSPTASIETDGNIIVGGLTASRPVIADAGKKLTVGTYSGNTTEMATVTGTKTTSQQLAFDASGNVIASGTAIGGASTLWEAPQGLRLSLTTNVYVTTTDVTAAGTLYWTTVISGGTGVVTGYNGAALATKTVQQKSLALTITSGKIKNVYYDYDGDTLAVGADWTNDTTPSETLADEQGAIVLSSDHTKLWLGAIRASGTNVCEDSAANRLVYNAYNQASRSLFFKETTGYTYGSATLRQMRGQAANQVAVLVGAVGPVVNFTVGATFQNGSTGDFTLAIGEDSTTAVALNCAAYTSAGTNTLQNLSPRITLNKSVPLGYHYYAGLERAPSGVTATVAGSDDDHFLGGTGSIIM